MVAGNFEGELSADGKTLTGGLYQNGVSPSLVLTRTSATPTLPAPHESPRQPKSRAMARRVADAERDAWRWSIT